MDEFDLLLNELVDSLREHGPLDDEQMRQITIAFVAKHCPEASAEEIAQVYDEMYSARPGKMA